MRTLALARFAPFGAVMHNPVRQGLLKADIAPRLFRLEPLVPQDFFALRLKLPVEHGIRQQVARSELIFSIVGHTPFKNLVET